MQPLDGESALHELLQPSILHRTGNLPDVLKMCEASGCRYLLSLAQQGLSTLLIEGDVFVEQFTEAAVHDRARIELSRRVEVVEDPAITARGARYRHRVMVNVHLSDGSLHTETREAPRGSEHSFAPAEDIIDKFRKLTRAAMPKAQQDALVEAVLKIETLADARDLIRHLQVSTG